MTTRRRTMKRLTWCLAMGLLAGCAHAAQPPEIVDPPEPGPPPIYRTPSPAPQEAKEEAKPERTADLPKQVGGFAFSQGTEAFAEACKAAGQQAYRVDAAGLACTKPAVSVGFDGLVGGTFCGAPGAAGLCEVMLTVDGDLQVRDTQVADLVKLLVGKYGQPDSVEGYDDPKLWTRCVSNQPINVRMNWYFSPKQTPPRELGNILLSYQCDRRGQDKKNYLIVSYRNGDGLRMRLKQAHERHDNF